MKIFKKIVLIFILLLIYTSVCAISYVSAISNNIANNVFRLHVIANSNSEQDQNLKYIVRDEILKYINSNSAQFNSKNELIIFLNNNMNNIQKIAENTIYENGFNYSVKIESGNFPFPTKSYGDISFPAGFYDGLKVKIGKAEGKNWWCVMFPPLCFVDVSSGIVPDESKEILKNNLPAEEYSILSENSDNINLKFKLIEVFQNLNIKIAKRD